MQEKSALGRAMAMVRDLRNRCDWDRAQTRETLRPYLIEEVHELDHAIGLDDRDAIRQEVGDLLLHLAWQLVLAEESGEFSPEDAGNDLEQKMKRRHPHLFDLGPKEGWEVLKRREIASGAVAPRHGKGVLGGLPASLPELLRAYRLQERAAGVGFDWPDCTGPADKVREELEEVLAELPDGAGRKQRLDHEIGDLLFSVVNLARKAGVHPGPALERANRRFEERFSRVEQLASARGIDLASAGLTVLDEMWNEAKRSS